MIKISSALVTVKRCSVTCSEASKNHAYLTLTSSVNSEVSVLVVVNKQLKRTAYSIGPMKFI